MTVLAYGPMVRSSLQAAQAAEEEGRSVEVIDLRSLSPLDTETIFTSVRKTGRVLVVHEASTFLGMGAELAAQITQECFYSLQAPVPARRRLQRPVPPEPARGRLPAGPGPDPRRHRQGGGVLMTVREFRLPDPGEGLTEAEIVSWRVAVGDTVAVNDVVVEVETAKSLVELPTPYAGTVTGLLVDEGALVEVGTPDHRHRHPRSRGARRRRARWGRVGPRRGAAERTERRRRQRRRVGGPGRRRGLRPHGRPRRLRRQDR